MIKKNTRMIFEEEGNNKELQGGIPLSKGEIVNVYEGGKKNSFEVVEKKIDFNLDGDDQTADITYRLKKVN